MEPNLTYEFAVKMVYLQFTFTHPTVQAIQAIN